jgi:hypothetical protein
MISKLQHEPFLILNFCLDIVDRVRGLDLEGDRLARKGFDENLHGFRLEVKLVAENVGLRNALSYTVFGTAGLGSVQREPVRPKPESPRLT